MLHACVERFDVMGGRKNILGWEGEVNKAIEHIWQLKLCHYENLATFMDICVERFDVMSGRKNILGWEGSEQGP
jgi:hypothetical protein